MEDADNQLPALFRTHLSLLQHHMAYLFDVIATLDKQIEALIAVKGDEGFNINRYSIGPLPVDAQA